MYVKNNRASYTWQFTSICMDFFDKLLGMKLVDRYSSSDIVLSTYILSSMQEARFYWTGIQRKCEWPPDFSQWGNQYQDSELPSLGFWGKESKVTFSILMLDSDTLHHFVACSYLKNGSKVGSCLRHWSLLLRPNPTTLGLQTQA